MATNNSSFEKNSSALKPEIVMSIPDTQKTVKYKCRGILFILLNKINRNLAFAAGINNKKKCLSILRSFIKINSSLNCACYRYFFRLAGYCGLQVKILNYSELKKKLLLY